MNIGIIGAGKIAGTVSKTLIRMPEVHCYAVASRDPARAEAFRAANGFEKAYGSYEEMLQDSKVDLVYIATPHALHAEHMRLCIRYRKPMICEKAFTLNADEAREVLAEAEAAGVFCTEAIWTRYMPSRRLIREMIESGCIGRVTALHASLFYPVVQNRRIVEPSLGGGALLDVGVYPLNFAVMCFGDDIERIESSCVRLESGVDGWNAMNLIYRDGKTAALTSGVLCRSDRQGVIMGDRGYIVVDNVNNPTSVICFDASGREVQRADIPPMISGYEYEFLECAECLRKGLIEAPSMPHRDTVRILELTDAIRKQWGLRYPQEM